ncbi:DUF3604 domain-containing protein [Robertkochia marina]|uniref:DUF3604 domain-containing protein n=1 Tax=Robertkochia marina TaxID=1227945 RepID=A0A4S3LXA0_9FLAO|nr:DUF3604 domain-containing protein [Robertkochia marina]THD65692.1 DUF3604 domain-containing protein [Robertkochia marina]TRZ46624.1 DUF3604 domain-containing protein [Robertkochia marina]
MIKNFHLVALSLLVIGIGNLRGQDLKPAEKEYKTPKKEYSPYAGDYYPDQVYFGDTHLHSSWSTDAGMAGATLGPDVAYRISRGETVTSHLGWKVRLIRPLDFLVLADHAENLGLADFIERSDPIILANETGKKWHDLVKAGNGYQAFLEWLRAGNQDLINEPRMAKVVWEKATDNADKYYQPGVFTTFHGFEWTSHPGGNNMHRVVVFRDGKDRTKQIIPYSQYDSVDPEDLWNYLMNYEEKTGGRVLAIPHNGNLSNGLMFSYNRYSGEDLTKEVVEQRYRFEPLAEVTQQKGDGETHPQLSPDDEFADFETLDMGNLNGTQAKTPDMLASEYAREALKRGLKIEAELGTNPFKFGMIGSSDNHTALPTTREENNFSKASFVEPSPERYEHPLVEAPDPALSIMLTDVGAAGLAAVWARENTRESIWDAMARRETYATSGTRLRVRVFGGWDFEEDEVQRPDFARTGYDRGVPMGGDLKAAPSGEAPKFMVRALRDPDGANLDRIQMIKGWMDAQGELQERVYDIAVSDGRKISSDGKANKAVGNTVDVKNASYTNSIGDPLLTAYWTDPDFDPSLRAFYYVRVLEIPTPRWTAYDSKFFNVKMPDDTVMYLQDRAYTSPIWYTPGE